MQFVSGNIIDYGCPEITLSEVGRAEWVSPNLLRLTCVLPHHDAAGDPELRAVVHLLVDRERWPDVLGRFEQATEARRGQDGGDGNDNQREDRRPRRRGDNS